MRHSLLLTVILMGCGPSEAPDTATVRVALEASVCADFCVDSIGAALYRDGESLPIGPAISAPCGEPLVFEQIPAGHRVRVRAWWNRGLGPALSGWSDPITVVADAVVEPAVALEPLAPPIVSTIAPEPLVVGGEPAVLTVAGEQFGAGQGLSAVEVGAMTLQPLTWSAGTLEVALPADSAGDAVVVRSCGVASAPRPIRLVGPAPTLAVLSPPGCAGLTTEALAHDGDEVLVAAACADGTGQLLRFRGADCSLAATALPLPAAPQGVAVDQDGVWLLSEGAVARDGEDPVAWPGGETPALIAGDGQVAWVISRGAETSLRRVDAPQTARLTTDLEVVDLAVAPDTVSLAAYGVSGEARLVRAPVAPGPVAEWSLPGCTDPTAMAVGPQTAVACGGAEPAVVGFDPGDQALTRVALPTPADALAVDGPGDVAFALSGTTLHVVHLPTERLLASWPLDTGAAPVVRLDARRLLLGGGAGGPLSVLSPYAGTAACPEAL